MDSQITPSEPTPASSPSVLAPPGALVFKALTAIRDTGFHFPTSLRESTANFKVYYHPDLASTGQDIADGVLATCERDYKIISDYFGGITPVGIPFNVIIASEVAGAYHWDCTSTDIYCQAKTTASPAIDFTRFALLAEVIEVFSDAQAQGWNCKASNGEGLSRVLATALYPAELGNFNSAAKWLNTPGRPDYINKTDPSDNNYVSIGCSVLFLNYLHYQLSFPWDKIVQAAAPTLGQTYSILTGSNECLQPFKSLLQPHYPEGTPAKLTTDNPFPL